MSKYQALIDALEAGPTEGATAFDDEDNTIIDPNVPDVAVLSVERVDIDGDGHYWFGPVSHANAAFYAEANPSTIRALLADLERAEKALREVVAVFDSNPSSIVDTVWVTGNRPETLYDHCQDALAQMAGWGEMACPRCGCKETYQYDEEDAPDDSFQRCAACGVIFSLDDETPEDEDRP